METVYGSRNCSCGCRGLISGEVYRYRHGLRKRYFENRDHVRRHAKKELTQIMKQYGVKPDDKHIEELTDIYINEFLEKVIVKPKEY
jgi:hypothetical protein